MFFLQRPEASGEFPKYVGQLMELFSLLAIVRRSIFYPAEKERLEFLKRSAMSTGFMHESFDKNDAEHYTRPWFAWSNAVFGELILQLARERPHLIFK